ncbi:PepSY domain-containing protein [Streptomyces genisteinicus]|uniref:PepSY domain-containing protein n=1 Tax=Streptomyces genisteinicus TaxID=2768068 RepID=A0A7H0HXS6_9ACTN|nr:PepSY domain-containing protein [Streptomyces genisteinicus]QNP65342.1 PepSY domain-containing protein [Streptomyces genisteinicus]
MKRKLVVATLTAAVLVGGGAYTAVAVSDDDAPRVTSTGTAADGDARDDDRDDDRAEQDGARDDDDRDDGRDDRPAASGGVTAAQAAAAALARTPGTVESVDLDDDGDGHWEVEVLGRDDREHELTVDASDGTVRVAGKDDDSDDSDDTGDRKALRDAKVDAGEAIAAVLKAHPDARVASADFDDDGDRSDHWEIELHDDRELRVDARTAAVSTD